MEGETLESRGIHNPAEGLPIPWDNRSQELEKNTLKPELIRKAVLEVLRQQVENVRKMHESAVAEIDEMRTKGVTYKGRIDTVAYRKMKWCETEGERITQVGKTLKIRPLAEWLDENSYDLAKQFGIRKVVALNLEQIIIT